MENFIDAVIKNDIDQVEAYLKQGIEPNVTLDNARITALHFAAQNNFIEIAKLLLMAGADPNCETDEGETPLNIAKQHHHKEMIQLLRSYQQPPNINLRI